MSRALSSLLARGHLAYQPWVHDSETGRGEQRFGGGYCLAAAGLAAGLPHEITVPDLSFRLWLLADAQD